MLAHLLSYFASVLNNSKIYFAKSEFGTLFITDFVNLTQILL